MVGNGCDGMLIYEILKEGTKRLANIDKPEFEARILLANLLNKDISYLYAHNDESVCLESVVQYFRIIDKRNSKFPLQYIIGNQEFMSLDFVVNQDVLIPRADTEILVEYAIELYKGYENPIHILDIGTGSGCISISLAYYIKLCDVLAIDISENAIKTAILNAKKNKVEHKLKFLKSDLFEKMDDYKNYFDLIVSNPPYIAESEIPHLQDEVKDYEPLTALQGGEDGLFFYRKILSDAYKYMRKTGFLLLEIGYDQADSLKAMALKYKYNYIETKKDFAGNNRLVVLQNPK